MRPADSFADPSDPLGPTRGARDAAGDATRDIDALYAATAEPFALALRAAIATGAIETGALQVALRAFVGEMRARGEPPERALVAIKERVAAAMQRRSDIAREQATAVARQIVHWTIEAYYRAD